jgi:hypothetical protein
MPRYAARLRRRVPACMTPEATAVSPRTGVHAVRWRQLTQGAGRAGSSPLKQLPPYGASAHHPLGIPPSPPFAATNPLYCHG